MQQQHHSNKKEKLQIAQLLTQIHNGLASLPGSDGKNLIWTSEGLCSRFKTLKKFIMYSMDYGDSMENKVDCMGKEVDQLNGILKKTKAVLLNTVCENSKLKSEQICIYEKLQEHQTEIQKLRVMNMINCSYAESMSFHENSENSVSSIEQKSASSDNSVDCSVSSEANIEMETYASDSEDAPLGKKDILGSERMIRYETEQDQDDQDLVEHRIRILSPPNTYLTEIDDDKHETKCLRCPSSKDQGKLEHGKGLLDTKSTLAKRTVLSPKIQYFESKPSLQDRSKDESMLSEAENDDTESQLSTYVSQG